jgi:hypothetical protein
MGAPFVSEPSVTPYALPGLLQEIAELVGMAAAIAIARNLGGRPLYIPTEARLKPTHPLARAAGLRAARLIARKWGGGAVALPSAKVFLHWYDARTLRLQGRSLTEIGRTLRLSKKRVHELLQGFDADAAVAEARSEERPEAEWCVACGRPLPRPKEHHCDERQGHLALPEPRAA